MDLHCFEKLDDYGSRFLLFSEGGVFGEDLQGVSGLGPVLNGWMFITGLDMIYFSMGGGGVKGRHPKKGFFGRSFPNDIRVKRKKNCKHIYI